MGLKRADEFRQDAVQTPADRLRWRSLNTSTGSTIDLRPKFPPARKIAVGNSNSKWSNFQGAEHLTLSIIFRTANR